jgi:hypothetical protein
MIGSNINVNACLDDHQMIHSLFAMMPIERTLNLEVFPSEQIAWLLLALLELQPTRFNLKN